MPLRPVSIPLVRLNFRHMYRLSLIRGISPFLFEILHDAQKDPENTS